MSDKDHESLLCRLLTRKQVLEIVPVSYATLWQWMREGQFPRALKIGPNSRVAWRADEVQAYVDSRPRQQLKGDLSEGGDPDPATQTRDKEYGEKP